MDASTILPFIAQQGAEISALKAEIAALKATPVVSAKDISLQAHITSLEATISMKQTINDELTAQNDSQIVQINELKRMNEAIQAKLNVANAKDSEQTVQIALFQTQITELTAQVADALRPMVSAPAVSEVPTKPVATPVAAPIEGMLETKLERVVPAASAAAKTTTPFPPAFRVVKTKTYSLEDATSDPDTLLRVAKAFAFTRIEKNRGIKIGIMELGDVISHLFMFRANKTNGKVIPFFRWVETNKPELTEEGRSLIPWLVESEDERDIEAIKAFNTFIVKNTDYMKA